MKLRKKFSLNGDLFLWKLYISEVVESVNQIFNCMNIYLCTMPVQVTIPFITLLAIDAWHRGHHMMQPFTVARRDQQVKVDCIADFLCAALPLSIIWFVYDVPISVGEILMIILWPSVCLLLKIRSLFKEVLRVRSETIAAYQADTSTIRHPRSLNKSFEALSLERVCKAQKSKMPRIFTIGLTLYSFAYGFFFFVVAGAHLGSTIANRGSANTPVCSSIRLRNCRNKIPFCKSLFKRTCNCAYLHIENNRSLARLPNSMVDNMKGLRRVFIRNCSLTALPPRLEQLTEMVDFEVSFNRLRRFDVDVSKWTKSKYYIFDVQ